jgi:quinol monooxygenase YgiN
MELRISDLKRVIRSRHDADSHLVAAEHIVHQVGGTTIWEGDVLVFHLVGHPIASKCFVWEMQGEVQSVLRGPLVPTAEEAVRQTVGTKRTLEPVASESRELGGEVTLVARVEAKPGLHHLVRDELMKLLAPTRAQAGCIRFELHYALDEPGTFLFYEIWRSQTDFDAYLESPLFKAWCLGCEDLVARRPEISRWAVVP